VLDFGSHLCDRLIKEGNDVICVDNLFTGSKDKGYGPDDELP